MADIVVVAAKVAFVDQEQADHSSYIAAEAITQGQPVYILSTGKVGVANALTAGKQQFRGIAMNGGGAGSAIDVCSEGELAGFTLPGNPDAVIYLSDTAGTLADAAGTKSVPVGRIVSRSDKDLTKVLHVFVPWTTTW